MKSSSLYPITSVSENMLTITLGDSINLETSKKVFLLCYQLLKNRHPSWLDIIPAYSTVSVVYDAVSIRLQNPSAFGWMKEQIEKLMSVTTESESIPTRQVQVPVCYDAEFAWDADRIEKEKNVSLAELISLHSSKSYHVFMIGFLPGFAYMGPVDTRIATPRIPTPRTNIHAGSVGIAGEQTGIYPLDSPGGWNIIGKTPLKIFNPAIGESVLFRPGDQVKFIPITKTEFEKFNSSNFKFIVDES